MIWTKVVGFFPGNPIVTLDLAHNLQGHFKVVSVFSNGTPYFWR